MRTIWIVSILLMSGTAGLFAYLPAEWNLERSKDDLNNSDVVVIGRVIGLNVIEKLDDNESKSRTYYATIRVGKILKGKVHIGETFPVVVGCCCVHYPDKGGDAEPSSLTLANTQSPHDFRLNGVYFLALQSYWNPHDKKYELDLTSGVFSIGWVTKNEQEKTEIRMGRLGAKWEDPQDYGTFLKECFNKLEATRER
ncbi:MAG: hypothetical protein V1809_00035 [Planctomycetota bacterium]